MAKEFKLKWNVAKDEDGNIVRRKNPGDKFSVDIIDVKWTHPNGFPPSIEVQPVSYDFRTKQTVFENVEVGGKRDEIPDQLSVSPETTDLVVCMMLDAKRLNLATSLGVEP